MTESTQEQQPVADSRSDMDAAGAGVGDATAITGTASVGTNDAGVEGPATSSDAPLAESVGSNESGTAGVPEAGQNQI